MLETIGLFDGILKEVDLEAIIKAERLFSNSGYYHHEYPCTEVLAIKDFENEEKADQIYNIYYENVDAAIMMFGVRIDRTDDPVSLKEMVEILDALLSLDDPEQADVISETIDSDESDPKMILATVISEFTEMNTMQLITKFESVDDSLINALKKITANPDLVGDIVQETMRIRKDYLDFTGDVKAGPVREYVKNIQELPIPFETTLGFLEEKILEVYDSETIAFELLSLGILAGFQKNELLEKTLEEAWSIDPDKYHEVERHIQAKHEEFMKDG